MRRLLPLPVLAVLAFAPAADASTLKFDTQQKKVSYEGGAGEVNQVTATQEGAVVRILDTGATMTIQGTACTAVSPNEATCPVSDPRHVVKIQGGDQDDHVTFTGTLSAQLDGDAGRDTLVGSDGADKLAGGIGDDTLDGRGGIDEYDGGDGDDEVRAQDGVGDSLVCGAGTDRGTNDDTDTVNLDCDWYTPPAPIVTDPGAPGAGLAEPVSTPAGALHAADPAVLAALPAPAPGRAVSAAAGHGTVLVRRPGARTFARLDPTKPVPVGSVLDATRGSVTLVAAKNLTGATQQATFTGGVFGVAQRRAASMTTVLTLRGRLECGSNRTSARAAARKKKKRSRRLWGDGHGRFTTRGKNSQASVRGTIWGVTDRCDGTLTQVKRGVVAVEDFRTGKTRMVRAGGRYLARKRTKNAR